MVNPTKQKEFPPADEKKDEEGEENKVEKLLSIVEKSVAQTQNLTAALQKERAEKAQMAARLARLEKAMTPPSSMTERDLPKSKDMTGEATKHPHPDGAVKGGDDTTSTEGAVTSDKVAKAIQDGIEAATSALRKEFEDRFEASTPTPWGMPNAPGIAKARKDLPGLIREIITKDREFCGAIYSSDDAGGFPSGTGDMNAREQTARFLNTQFGGAL